MTERKRVSGDGEPLLTERRCVREHSNGNELFHNIPDEAVRLLDVDADCETVIEIYSDGYVVHFEDA